MNLVIGYDGPLQYTMVQGNPDLSTDVIHLSRSFSRDSDDIDGELIFYSLIYVCGEVSFFFS